MAEPRLRFWPAFRDFSLDFVRWAGAARIVASSALVGLGALLDSVNLLMLVPILAVVVDSGDHSSWWRKLADKAFGVVGANSQFERLAALMVIFGAVVVLRGAVVTVRDIRLQALQLGFLQHLRGRLAELLAAAPWAKLARLRHARITHVMSGDLARVSAGATYLVQSTVSVVTLVVQCALAIWLAPMLAGIALSLIAVVGLIVAPLVRRSQLMGRHVTVANLTMLESTGELLGGLKLAISQNLQTAFVRRFRETLETLTRRQVDNARQNAFARLVMNLFYAAVAALIVLLGFGPMHVPIAALITLLIIIQRMSGPVTQLQQGLQSVAYALPAYEHMLEVTGELEAPADERATVSNAAFPRGSVVFEKVTFRHPAEADEGRPGRGVEGLDLVLEPGEFLGVAGASGAGKTTFVDLLVGLLAPQAGRLTVGGAALEGEALAGWRTGIGYISQDPFLFHDTIRRNLAWAAPDASEADLWRCLTLAGVDELVRRMELGLDTVVGERGSLVSGGERQRIALARALLRRPKLLVLDEATNAIDIASERVLVERLGSLDPQPTIVMIAHRSESLALCRRVVEMRDGALAGGDAAREAARRAGG